MHIPDGFLSAPVAISSAALSAAAIGYATWRARRTVPSSQAPLLGLSAAFIFAAQMLNFPVGYGTSGHLVGAVLACVLLRPTAAIIALTSVLILQCFMFADGGISALGANLLNMAILGVVCGYSVWRIGVWLMPKRPALAAGIAAWLSTVIASAACAGEIALSGKAEARLLFPALIGTHCLIGIGEGMITAMILAAIARLSPSLLQQASSPARHSRLSAAIVFGCISAIALALFIAPFACGWPDGLEHVATSLGFDTAAGPVLTALFPDYRIAGIFNQGLSTFLAGLAGTLTILALTVTVAVLFSRQRIPNETAPVQSAAE
jgi:cobalt/nickel transport system permease protein